jgi:cell division protein ZapA (FtsZ GTPase activity inhibitor)
MENNKRKVSLNIAGNKISLVTDESPEYVEKLAALVSQRVNTLSLSGSGITKMDAALVYALDLLDENFKLKIALAEAKKNNG